MASLQPVGPRSRSLWAMFGLAGRLSRSVYWLCYGVIVCVQSAVLAQVIGGAEATYYDLASGIGPVVLLATFVSSLAVAVKRLHDIGYSGFLALALFIPLVNVAFTIWAGIIPGTSGPNRYGPAPDIRPS